MAVMQCTARQAQILEQAAQGRSDKQIALALGMSIHTVRTHLQRLYRAGGFSNRAEAVAAWLAQQPVAPVADPDTLSEEEERVAAAAAQAVRARLPAQTAPAPLQADLINQARVGAGLQAIAWDERLAEVAAASARRMAAAGHLDTIIGSPEEEVAVGAENVGYWSGINDAQLHALFVADPKQRGNVLGPHQRVGAAWAVTETGVAFLSVVFA